LKQAALRIFVASDGAVVAPTAARYRASTAIEVAPSTS
jgi:hypothetical protein